MSNPGKIFESDIKQSVPSYALIYRIPDLPQSFNRAEGMRFSIKNPFDFILWDSKRKVLYALEMKSVGGKSISFERTKDEHGEIHYHQIKSLNNWNQYDGIVAGFVIEFRELEKTVFIDIDAFNLLLDSITKKSFNMDDIEKFNIQHLLIPRTKKRTRFAYDIETLLSKNELDKEFKEDSYEERRSQE